MRILPLPLPLLLVALISTHADAALKSIHLPSAADGQVEVFLDTDTKLPVGASDGKAKVTTAALAFLPKKPGDPLLWTWQYAIGIQPGIVVKSVRIEDEKGASLRLLVQDDSPSVSGGTWTGQEPPQAITREFFDAMNSNDMWMLLLKITIVYGDGQSSVLHQLVLEPPAQRRGMLDAVMKAGGKKE